ncbi:PLP-dependent transferase [Diplogelasinospora grovesii]|uniref:PLP-dependent transferase n=1 Tax=Diplogelasinospora grovesii TaxID=303347 RepID=A0AAN6N2U1_9PEZI|nr:PLP-dependent transferase [Diplogelasinospora grovesii]
MLSRRGTLSASQLDIPWRFAPGGYDKELTDVISFATAENALVQDELEKFVKAKVHIPGSAFLYRTSTAGGRRLPCALADHLNEYFCAPDRHWVTRDNIIVTNSVTAMNEILGFSLGDPGDGILTSVPCYDRFELDFGNKAQLRMVYTDDTDAETSFLPSVVDSFERALVSSQANGVRICALLIVNPHNPLGKCYPRQTLSALIDFCIRHQIHLISDELYGLTVFDSSEQFTSVLSLVDGSQSDHKNLIHVTYGMSKDFGAAGIRLGALVTGNTTLKKAVKSVVRFHNPSGVSVAIATAMLEDREWKRTFLDMSRLRIKNAYELIASELKRIKIPFAQGVTAGFFVYADLSKYLPPLQVKDPSGANLSNQEREFALANKLKEGGIWLHPGEEHAIEPGWFRIVYTRDEKTVREGLKRLENVLETLVWPA